MEGNDRDGTRVGIYVHTRDEEKRALIPGASKFSLTLLSIDHIEPKTQSEGYDVDRLRLFSEL